MRAGRLVLLLGALVGTGAACRSPQPRGPWQPRPPVQRGPVVHGRRVAPRRNVPPPWRPSTPTTDQRWTRPTISTFAAFSHSRVRGIELEPGARAQVSVPVPDWDGLRTDGGVVGLEAGRLIWLHDNGAHLRAVFALAYEGFEETEREDASGTVVTKWGPLQCIPFLFCWRNPEETETTIHERTRKLQYHGVVFTAAIESGLDLNKLRAWLRVAGGVGLGEGEAAWSEHYQKYREATGQPAVYLLNEATNWQGDAAVVSFQLRLETGLALQRLPQGREWLERFSLRLQLGWRWADPFALADVPGGAAAGTADLSGTVVGGSLALRF